MFDLIEQRKVDVEALRHCSLGGRAEWFGRLYNKEPGLLKVVLKP